MSIREGSPAGNFPPIVLPHRFAVGFQTKSEWGALQRPDSDQNLEAVLRIAIEH